MPFLVDALKSYEKFIDTGQVDVVLIDNGSDSETTKVLMDWKIKHKDKVRYFRNEINNPAGFTYFWDLIESCKPEWILNPGDDDILVFDAYAAWLEALEKNPSMNAFATSARIIDIAGNNTGEVRTPAIINATNPIEMISCSLNQPPFFWPSLYFRFAAIQKPVIISRFVHDWWIGLQLVLAGQVYSTSSIGIHYRVHGSQESYQVPSRRKFFEGFNMLSDFIRGPVFQSAIKKLSDLEKNKLFELCILDKPLYSQPDYSVSLIKELADALRRSSESHQFIKLVSEKFAISAGVYTKKGDLGNLYTGCIGNKPTTEGSDGNFSLVLSSKVCKELSGISKFFNESESTKIIVSCKHSNSDFKSLFLDCSKFKHLSTLEISDLVLVLINQQLETKGQLSFTSTPFEKNIILFTRKIKFRFPKIVSIIKKSRNL
jgi:glycosyltransferase involved in cell wall biosynthesis